MLRNFSINKESFFNFKIILIIFLVIILLSAGLNTNSKATNTENSEQQMLKEFLTKDQLEEEMFSQKILSQLSVSKLRSVRNNFIDGLGKLQNIEKIDKYIYQVFYEKGKLKTQFVVTEGKVAGVRFLSVTKKEENLESIKNDFSNLPGEVSLLVTKKGKNLISLNPDQKMAVGSTFKIAVLSALQEKINSDTINWTDLVVLKKEDISLPSGDLQNWPIGTKFTVESLAGRMISKSDNTATDMLIRYIGRKNIEKKAPDNQPFLKTKEAFYLKIPENKNVLNNYRNAEKNEKYKILDKINEKSLSIKSMNLSQNIRALDIEWFFSTKKLKELMYDISNLDLMTINPGPIQTNNWQRVAYKGGSEPGVLNYTHMLTSKNGNIYFVTATWNNKESLNTEKFIKLYQTLINQLQK